MVAKRLALLADLESFLRLDGLVQPFGVATPIHEPARELIHDNDFGVLDDVLAVLSEEDLCPDGVAKDLAIGGLLLQQLVLRNPGCMGKPGQQIVGRLDRLVLLFVDVVRAIWSLGVIRRRLRTNSFPSAA